MGVRLAGTTGSAKGQLSVEVTTSANVIHRGGEFLVDIKVTNGFDKDVQLKGWSWEMPAWINAGESPSASQLPITVRPGDSWTIAFSMSSERPYWAFGSRKYPEIGAQSSALNLSYQVGTEVHTQSVDMTLDIHAHPNEVYLAAFVGGVVGSLVNTVTLGLSTLVSGVLGLFLVLIAQRRANVQLGISIEDAIGGLVVGFVLGYLGTAYFKGFLPTV
jgi:hypothetical protein